MVNNEIREIADRIVNAVHHSRVLLFGSFARNEENENSDYDICVLTDNSADSLRCSKLAYRSLLGMGDRRPCDIVVYTESDYASKSVPGSFLGEIAKDGVELYAR